MTVREAAAMLGIEPASVHNRVSALIRQQGQTPGALFDGRRNLTRQAQDAVLGVAGVASEQTGGFVSSEQSQNALSEKVEFYQSQTEALRKEVGRLQAYIEQNKELTRELIRAISELEDRVERLEASRVPERPQTGPQRVLAAVRGAVARPVVYYANVLRR